MFQSPSMRRRLLDALAVAALLGALLSGYGYLGLVPPGVSSLLFGSVLLCAALWPVVRQLPRRGLAVDLASVGFVCAATAAWFFANSTLGLGMSWIATVVVARKFGGAALIAYGVMVIGIGAGTHLLVGTAPLQLASEVLGSLPYLILGGLFSMLLRSSEAAGFLLKNVSTTAMCDAIHQVMRGGTVLDPRVARAAISRAAPRDPQHPAATGMNSTERAVARLLAEGATNRVIAERLHLAHGTVKNTVSAPLRRFNAPDRTALALRLAAMRWD